MSSIRRDELYLRDIISACGDVQGFTVGLDEVLFCQTKVVHKATLYCLTVIGEAVNKLPDELKNRYADVPWKRIKAFRNLAIHDYGGVDLPQVWQIIEQHVPQLKARIQAILDAEFPTSQFPQK